MIGVTSNRPYSV